MKLHYREMGQGKPFVILHGLFGYSDNWQSHAKKIAAYYRVILVDLRNHGHSPWSDDFSYELMADDVFVLVQDLSLEDIILLGHSMGGKTAMTFAQKHEDKLAKLIVVDMGIKSYPMHHEEIIAGLHAVDVANLSSRSQAEERIAPYLNSEGVKQFLLKNLYWNEHKKLAWRMNLPILETKMNEILAALNLNLKEEVFTPSLFIRGEQSNYVLDEDWFEIEHVFPDAILETIENAGHWVHAEAPEEFLEKVLSFCLR